VDPRLHDLTIDGNGVPARGGGPVNAAQLKEKIESSRLVAATCLTASASKLLGAHRRFDFCIVDEAGQISQPNTIGALCLCK
jgi:superfamily I DNA and/or RNA helicase